MFFGEVTFLCIPRCGSMGQLRSRKLDVAEIIRLQFQRVRLSHGAPDWGVWGGAGWVCRSSNRKPDVAAVSPSITTLSCGGSWGTCLALCGAKMSPRQTLRMTGSEGPYPGGGAGPGAAWGPFSGQFNTRHRWSALLKWIMAQIPSMK